MPCPSCGTETRVHAFPALFRSQPAPAVGELSVAGEAGCFYHPDKRAIVTCHLCGRFLCGLCNVDFKQQNWCPGCLESSSRKRKGIDFENHRVLYDSVALAFATLPFLALFYPSLIGAPVALYISVRYWKAPGSILPRTKIRFLVAILLAIGQLVLMGALIYTVVHSTRRA
ncbi:MAG TPA: hypothetical protein VK335_23180 [Bryobacteraceae bacterium]|nr:hypothetical protein [Bryobacteraceae bacterium]